VEIGFEKTAEAADAERTPGSRFFAMCVFHEFDSPVAGGDVDAGGRVTV
jgi:hypothetical protein